MTTQLRGRWEFLDTVRGLAALGVLFTHGLGHCIPGFFQWSLQHGDLGLMGVVAFFLVSGFIIPLSVERYHSLKKFWIGRFFRLMPMYFFSLVLCVALDHLGLRPLPLLYDLHPLRFVAANLTMFQEFLHVPHAIGAYWTLAYELIFCLLCSALFALGSLEFKKRWAWISLFLYLGLNIFCALFLHRSLSAAKLGLLVTAFFGALVYSHFKGRHSAKSIFAILPPLALTFVIVFMLRFSIYPKAGEEVQFTTLGSSISFLAGYLLFFAAYALREKQFPRSLLWLGRISYSLYLIHGIVIDLVPPTALGFLELLIVSLGVAHLTYTWIEKPMMDFQHRVNRG